MMDDRGFIFTTDAVLALVVVTVLTASIVAYQFMPQYMGDDQQHLEALADSVLNVMYQDGTLYSAAGLYANGNNTQAQNNLTAELNSLLPSNVGYRLTIDTYPSVEDDRGIAVRSDVATKVKVISGPREGWMGRAWYKLEEVQFEDQKITAVTTLWNFHNWLTNYDPWSTDSWFGRQKQLSDYPYWGYRSGNPHNQSITFSVPNASINGGRFLIGASDSNSPYSSYAANFVLNGVSHNAVSSKFVSLYTGSNGGMYNYQNNLTKSELPPGINSFYINFYANVTNSHDMPWFSLIGNYSTIIKVPTGINPPNPIPFANTAGLAYISGSSEYITTYNLDTGAVSTSQDKKQTRKVTWTNLLNKNFGFDDGTPFIIDNVPGVDGTGDGSAVSVVQNINLPAGNRLYDGYVVINAYGAVDGALVEVWDGSKWNTAFCSFDASGKHFSDRSDGYGNIPGIVYIKDYLKPGQNNKVRVTVWDDVPGSDYDLVGLTNCYSMVSYSSLPIFWENFPYYSLQVNSNTNTQTRTFDIKNNATKAYLFVGAGTDTKNIQVDYGNGSVLYNGPVPYVLDLGNLDVANCHVITNGTSDNYTFVPGNYTLRVTVTAGSSWESGDGASDPPSYANAEIFSGTRIEVLYPKFLQNLWTAAYADNAQDAENIAVANLNRTLRDNGIPVDESLIQSEAMYTGDLPNALPVRLELWEK